MKYIKFTYVDAVTGVSVAAEPAMNGTKFPEVPGLQFVWARESAYPTEVPEFFGTCPDDSPTQADGVLGVFVGVDFASMQADEMNARSRVPKSVSPRQIRQALTRAGLRTSVEAAVAAGDQDTKDWYEFATQFERSSPIVAALGAALSVTDVQLDALWTLAGTL
jgi:hypothetical protein